MKRIFDFIAALIGLVFLFPIFVVIGFLMKLNNNRPVFFEQNRARKSFKIFELYKFRFMSVVESTKEGVFEPGNISRIMTVDKFLRKTKLDELSQLFNVLKGEMSVVGPSSEVEKWISVFSERRIQILIVFLGMIDNASVIFSNE